MKIQFSLDRNWKLLMHKVLFLRKTLNALTKNELDNNIAIVT